MKPSSQALTASVVRSWVRFYTAGLPRELRDERRIEIESDLWEHLQDTESASTAQLMLRLLMGVPSDMAWRVEARAVRYRKAEYQKDARWTLKERAMTPERIEKGFIILVILLAAYQAVVAVFAAGFGMGLWGGGEDDAGSGWYVTLPILCAGLLFLWMGLRQRTEAPLRAGVFIAVGVLPSILMFWMMVPPVIALIVAVYAIVHGRTQQHQLNVGA